MVRRLPILGLRFFASLRMTLHGSVILSEAKNLRPLYGNFPKRLNVKYSEATGVKDCLMSESKRILILTSKTGGGHLSLAEALRDLLSGNVPVIGGMGEHDTTGTEETETAIFKIVDPQPRFIHLHYRFVSRRELW